MGWIIRETEFKEKDIAMNGNKFLIFNGYVGVRGSLEEYSHEEYAGCLLAGMYDLGQGQISREPVNIPNGLYTMLIANGKPVTPLQTPMKSYEKR